MYQSYQNELYHHGVKGMKWGVRRYQNKDGTRTALGKRRRSSEGIGESIKTWGVRIKKKVSDNVNLEVLAEKTEGYTQAEIENIVVKALELTQRKKLDEITQETLELALKYMLTAQSKKIKEMEDIALKECNDLELLPEKYFGRLKELRNME